MHSSNYFDQRKKNIFNKQSPFSVGEVENWLISFTMVIITRSLDTLFVLTPLFLKRLKESFPSPRPDYFRKENNELRIAWRWDGELNRRIGGRSWKGKPKKRGRGEGELIGFRGGKRKESWTIRSSGRDIESTLISKHLRALTSWKLSKTPPLSFTFAPDGTRVSRFERWFILRLSIDPREGDARDALVEREVARVSESWIEKKKEKKKERRRCNRVGLRFRRFWNIFGTSFPSRSKFYGP